MHEESQSAEIHITFYIRGFEDMPSVITNILGIRPTSTHVKGERRFSKGGTYRENMWVLDAEVGQIEDMGEGVHRFIGKLEVAKDKFLKLPEDCILELCCGVSILHGPAGPPFTIDRHSMKFLGDIGASIDVDIYCLDED